MLEAKESRELALEESGKAGKRIRKVNGAAKPPTVRTEAVAAWVACPHRRHLLPTAGTAPSPLPPQAPGLRDEWGNVLLLVVLYMIQGIPLGLSMGSM